MFIFGHLAIAAAACGGSKADSSSTMRSNRYDDLRALFADWRAFQKPKVADGVPDYSQEAMAAQKRELPSFVQRLNAIAPKGWLVSQQVDWSVVRAETSGRDFDHRVLRPWANNPAYYVTVFPSQSDQPAREGRPRMSRSSCGRTSIRYPPTLVGGEFKCVAKWGAKILTFMRFDSVHVSTDALLAQARAETVHADASTPHDISKSLPGAGIGHAAIGV